MGCEEGEEVGRGEARRSSPSPSHPFSTRRGGGGGGRQQALSTFPPPPSLLRPPAPLARPQKGQAAVTLAVSDAQSGRIHLYDVSSGSNEPFACVEGSHRAPVVSMKYNLPYNTVISTDAKGAIPRGAAPATHSHLSCD